MARCDCDDGWVSGYGFFLGGDPRNYTPDGECCTPEEIEAHKQACARWDRGEKTDEGHSGVVIPGVARICGHRFGIGVYQYACDACPAGRAVEASS